MKYSEQIEDFLNFLRDAKMDYDIACMDERDTNDATQDILHSLELEENSYHESARLARAMTEVRRARREAKDRETHLQPIVDWISESQKTVKELERLLGAVRKAEKSTEGRYYRQKTDVVEKALGGGRNEIPEIE